MKNLVYILILLISTSVLAQVTPKEIKEEVEVKTLKVKDNEKTTQRQVKVITRETADVELDENDANKTNQERVAATTKVEKMTYVNDNVLTNETSYKMNDGNYVFSPNETGFEMSQSRENNQYEKIGKSWASSVKGYYIVDGAAHSGIGYFDQSGNFVTEYYNNDTKQVEVKTYLKK
jgi:hypothetical protein